MLLTVQIAGFIALAALLSGCILLYLRLRNIASTSLLLSLVALAAWIFWIQGAVHLGLSAPATAGDPGQGTNAAEAIAALGHSQDIGAVCEALLMLWVGISFFFAIRSIRSQRAA